MKGSRVAKVAMVSVLTVVFLGGMWVASGAELPLAESNESFTVPLGNFGDRAEYLLQDTFEAGTHKRIVTWDFRGPETIIDRYGNAHATVRVDINHKWIGTPGRSWLWPMKSFLDVNDRQEIRKERAFDQGQTKDLVQQYTVNTSHVELGPISHGHIPQDLHRVAAHAQGMTFHVGDDVSDQIGFFGPNRPLEYDFGQTVTVLGQGALQGATVWAVLVQNWETDFWHEGGIRWTEREWENGTFWFSESSPVPVRVEFDWHETLVEHRAGGEDFSWAGDGVASLASFTSGSRPIPWGVPRGALAVEVVGEQSNQPYPTSGSTFRAPYRLEDAIASVESDPSLVAFTAWKETNPGWRLVGFLTTPGQTPIRGPDGVSVASFQPFGGRVPMWYLRYSAPFGETVIMIESFRAPDGRIVNTASKAQHESYPPALRFNPDWMPASFTVMSEADKFWQTVVDSAIYDLGPNNIRWGYSVTGMSDPESGMKEIAYGRITENDPVTQPISEFGFELAVINASTGAFEYGYRTSRWPELPGPLSAGEASVNEKPELSAAPTGRVDVLPLAAGAASLSVLLLVAVYLFPILQQGAVGLYTKLVKHQLLDNHLRDQLVHLIRENPGISPPALRSLTGAGWTTVIYHLSVLSDNQLVTSTRDGRHRRYFLVGATNVSSFREISVLRNERTRQVFELVRAQPGIDRGAIARLVGVHTNAVVWHLERLAGCGLVKGERRGRFIAYSVSARQATTAEVGLVPA